jgi:hypothetical protein
MKRLATVVVLAGLVAGPVVQAQPAKPAPPKNFEALGWLAGTRYVERDGVKSYETWTGPAAGQISGSVASASNGGLVEFFKFGPNEAGVYGLATARTTTGLTNWSFRPLKTLEPRKIVFADATGSFSIEPTPDGGIHNIATRIVDGKESKSGEWFWLPVK